MRFVPVHCRSRSLLRPHPLTSASASPLTALGVARAVGCSLEAQAMLSLKHIPQHNPYHTRDIPVAVVNIVLNSLQLATAHALRRLHIPLSFMFVRCPSFSLSRALTQLYNQACRFLLTLQKTIRSIGRCGSRLHGCSRFLLRRHPRPPAPSSSPLTTHILPLPLPLPHPLGVAHVDGCSFEAHTMLASTVFLLSFL
ncbi:hypothetical protein BLNAU_16860 [Blattamonas nauphoetae]|uniref:Uncharacterized protein n=1 Tax=Blattamonas nauphoetae TaxID=2049346 RepID=A0ABQ9X8K4_9EUKA|nr:hypothetical protein BLNAU_16860 [Blattamonas nauphoetae]